MYRTCGAQHGYKPMSLEPRECIVPLALNMVTSSSNLEPRMYRIFDAQHVYKFLRNLETRMYCNFVTQHGYDVFKKNVCIDFRLF